MIDGLDPERLGLETLFLLRACGLEAAQARDLAYRPLPFLPAADLREEVLYLCVAGPATGG